MSIRWRNNRPIVEVYDPTTGKKRHVKARDFDMDLRGLSGRALARAAQELERRALDHYAGRRENETCASFAERWVADYPGRESAPRSEGTRKKNQEVAVLFARDFGSLPLARLDRTAAREWAREHPARLAVVRAMFNDALDDGLVSENPFSKLGVKQSRGRRDIVVLTAAEVDRLAEVAVEQHGEDFGGEVRAMILWAAYTCLRPGETFAATFSQLHDDTYDVQRQWNSTLRRETAPKHGSTGLVYVPEPARLAVLGKPRRLGDDLMFRTVRGRQFNRSSWHYAWDPVRRAFTNELPEDHTLRRRLAADQQDRLDFHELRHFGASYMLNVLGIEPWLIAQQLRHSDGGALVMSLYGHPERQVAVDRIRAAYGDSVVPLRPVSGDSRGMRRGERE